MSTDYSFEKFPFMRQAGPSWPVSEDYVSIPPGLIITESDGTRWTLGFDYGGWRTGEFEYDVVRNGKKTGEFACRIEWSRRRGLRIFGKDGWRTWNGKTFI